jgi:pimeloyl-ACP methyl ester carboxylesterase
MADEIAAEIWRSRFLSAPDGLKLHLREAGAPHAAKLPVICLPGLTRNNEDFWKIGERLAAAGHRVIAMDYRGRGLSDHDPEWKNYDLRVELDDLISILTGLGITRAVFLGTSRGGLLTALMGLAKPALIAGAILNDIGPVIEAQGLARIRGYVGKIPLPRTFEEGAATLKQMFGAHFPDEPQESWLAFARRTWAEDGTALTIRYDRNLMKPLAELDLEKPMGDFWPQFGALAIAPLMVIRGEFSDLLSQATAEEMVRRHGNARLHIAPRQGHAPLLEDEPTITAILDFVATLG